MFRLFGQCEKLMRSSRYAKGSVIGRAGLLDRSNSQDKHEKIRVAENYL
jgi:hypothetical protein